MRKFTKKAMATALVAAMTVSLVGCGGSDSKDSGSNSDDITTAAANEDTSITDEDITLRFNWWGGDTRHAAYLSVIDAFQEKYSNITVKAEYESWSGHEEAMATQLSGGTAADILQINWGWIFDYSPDASTFYDINKLANIIDLSNYDQGLLELCTVNGSLQAIPTSLTGRVFYFNKATFEQAGIEIPTTLDELKAAGQTFQEKLGDDYYPLVLGEYDRMLLMVYYLESVYGMNWVEDGELQYSEEQIVEGLQFIIDLEESHVIPSIETINGDGAETIEVNTKWYDGRYAGIYEWDSSSSKYAKALENKDNFVAAEFINMGDYNGGYTKISMAYAINADTEYPNECATFLQFLVAEDGVELMGTECGITANSTAYSTLEGAKVFDGNLTAEANALVVAHADFVMDSKFENAELKNADGTYCTVMEALSYGEGTPEELAAELMDGINDVLSE